MDTRFIGKNTWSAHPEYDRGFEAGQQSKQAEIDALKAKIDEAMELLEHNEYTDSHLQALGVLRGE